MISKCCAFACKFTNFDIIPLFFQILYHKIGWISMFEYCLLIFLNFAFKKESGLDGRTSVPYMILVFIGIKWVGTG